MPLGRSGGPAFAGEPEAFFEPLADACPNGGRAVVRVRTRSGWATSPSPSPTWPCSGTGPTSTQLPTPALASDVVDVLKAPGAQGYGDVRQARRGESLQIAGITVEVDEILG